MATLLYTVWSITNVASMHCAVRPEISPCTCEPVEARSYVQLSCEKVDSFHHIVDALKGKFNSNLSISLLIAHSQLDDLEMRSFTEMNLNVTKLRLTSDNLRSLPERPFRGLSTVELLSLADNELDEIPKHALHHLPKIHTLDFANGRIRNVNHDDFKGVPKVVHLILVSNNITKMDQGAFPSTLKQIHLGRNRINDLNGTLRDLKYLESLFVNMNNITTLEDELPDSPFLKFILAQNNSLEHLPQSLKNYPNMESLYFQNNKIKSLDGILKNGRKLGYVQLANNEIEFIAEDDFFEAHLLEELDLSCNNIKSLNGSLVPLYEIRIANFSFNKISEFSIDEIRSLIYIKVLDLSYNNMERLRPSVLYEPLEVIGNVFDLYLQHNNLKSLDNALSGLTNLRSLILTHNKLERLTETDLQGMVSLESLDLSYNQIITLEELAMTTLPILNILKVAHNNLTALERDFHGMPTLCHANLMHNHITTVSYDLVSKTKCSNLGVPGKLEVWLENNPIMCDASSIGELCAGMDVKNARVRGKSQCIENDLEVCLDEFIEIVRTTNSRVPYQQKYLIRAAIPFPPLTTTTTTLAPTTTKEPTTTTTTLAPTTTNSTIIEPILAEEMEPTVLTSFSEISKRNIENQQTENPSLDYPDGIIKLDEVISPNYAEDNSVHGQYTLPIVVSKRGLLQREQHSAPAA